MSKWSLFNSLRPSRLLPAIRRRGVGGTVVHGLRRAGTMMGHPLVGPDSIRINPMGVVCNHACPMCWLQHTPPEKLKEFQRGDRELGMKLADYVKFFDSLPTGLREVNLVGGGEPLIHPEVAGIMSEIKRRGWRGSLISNGTLLKEPLARAMIDMRWDSTRISVHAGDPETYHAIQGVDRFQIMRENLKRFDRLRREAGAVQSCELIIFHVIQRENILTIEKLFEIGEEVGADFVVFEKVIALDKTIQLTPEELRTAGERLESCARAARVSCNIDDILPQLRIEETCARECKPFRPAARCSVGYDQAYVTSMGDVLPCCFSKEIMGNLRRQSFQQIWHGEKYRNFRNRLMNGRFASYCIESHCAMKDVLHN